MRLNSPSNSMHSAVASGRTIVGGVPAHAPVSSLTRRLASSARDRESFSTGKTTARNGSFFDSMGGPFRGTWLVELPSCHGSGRPPFQEVAHG